MSEAARAESGGRLHQVFPILDWLPSYRRSWLGGDVLDLELTYDLDVAAAEALLQLANRLDAAGVSLALARVHGPVVDMLERAGVVDAVGRERVGGRVEDVVRKLEP